VRCPKDLFAECEFDAKPDEHGDRDDANNYVSIDEYVAGAGASRTLTAGVATNQRLTYSTDAALMAGVRSAPGLRDAACGQ
jgi:hypothetical protein